MGWFWPGRVEGTLLTLLGLAACGGGGTSSGSTRPGASSVATESLMAYWNFDESGGTAAADTSSFALHPFSLFNYSDNSHWLAGLFNNALSFSKSLSQYAMATWSGSESFQLKTADAFSISLWFKMNAATYNADTSFANQYMLFWQGGAGQNCWGGGTAAAHEICLSVNYIPNNLGNRLSFFYGYVEDNPNHGPDIEINSELQLTSNPGWHHVVVTMSGLSSATATAQMYINGLQGTAPSGSVVQGFTDTGTQLDRSAWLNQFYIGRPVAAQRFFDGQIDEFRIYNRVLSAEEILTLFQAGSP